MGSRIALAIEDRRKLVNAAGYAGVRYVDTALFYGVGAAERVAGDAFRDRPREEWALSTKGGHLLRPHRCGGRTADGRFVPLPFEVMYDYWYDGTMRSMEVSHQRLA